MMPYSGDRRLTPPPQLHSTLSYLSPSATPFTVARPRATPDPIPNNAPNPSPYPDLPTAPSLFESWVEPPASYMDPADATAPGYAGFASASGFLLPESAPNVMYSGNHFGTPTQLPFFTTNSSEWMEEKYPGIYQRTTRAPSSDVGSSVAHQSSLPPSMLDCSDKKPRPVPQPVNQYPAYDNYMSHLPSSSANPLSYGLSMPPVRVSPDVSAVTKTLPSTSVGHTVENALSSLYMNPCRFNLDYFDSMQTEQKDPVGSYPKYDGSSSSDYGLRTVGNNPVSAHQVGENYLVGESSRTERPLQPSAEGKPDLKSLQASCSKVSPSELEFAQPHDLFTESFEVNNHVVDSPCWKGTPTARQPLLGVVKYDEAPYSANGLSGLHDLHQSKKLPELSTDNSGLFSKNHDTSKPENDPSLPYCINFLSAFGLPLECQMSDAYRGAQQSNVGAFSGMTNYPGYLSLKQGTRIDKRSDMGDNCEDVVAPDQQGCAFPVSETNESTVVGKNIGSHVGSLSEESVKKPSSHVGSTPTVQTRILTNEDLQESTSHVHKAAATWENLYSEMSMYRGLEHLPHCSPSVKEDIVKISSDDVNRRSNTQAELIQSMHNLSAMLLSTCNGGYELKDSEHALVQSAIQNLKALSSKRSKAASKVDDVNSICCQTKSEKVQFNGRNCQPEKFAEPHSADIGTDFKTFIFQDLAKLPEENMVDDTRDAQIYKNLWIEAEASVCKLKYELQLARMKLAMQCHSPQKGAAPADLSGEAKASDLPKSATSLCNGEFDDSSKQQNHAKERNLCSATLVGSSCDGQSAEVNTSTADKVGADVFARLKILKSRDDNMNSLHEDKSEQQQETINHSKTNAVDDGIIDNTVDDRINSLVEDIINDSSKTSESEGEGDDGDDAIIAAIDDFISRSDKTSPLDEDVNQERPESSQNKADSAVMARLNQLEDGVMARLQVLKRRIDNTSSVVEDGQEVLHPDDWARYFEGKQFGSTAPSGTHDGLIGKNDLPDDVKCATPLSDEVNVKPAFQYPSTLLEEPHVFSAPAEHASLQQHDEQSNHSPSEWEHVLKEDFFLPV